VNRFESAHGLPLNKSSEAHRRQTPAKVKIKAKKYKITCEIFHCHLILYLPYVFLNQMKAYVKKNLK